MNRFWIKPSATLMTMVLLGACSADVNSSTAPTSPPVKPSTTTVSASTTSPPTSPPTSVEVTTTLPASPAVPLPPDDFVQPPASPTACPDGTPADQTCFSVNVPVDPTHPTAGSLNLAVTTRRVDPSTWTSPVLSICSCGVSHLFGPPPAPTFYPGHDIVWVDGRGAGRSDGATDCADLRTIPGQLGTANLGAAAIASVKACFAKAAESSVPLSAIVDHDLAAADIIAVRHALGIDKWAVNTAAAGADVAVRLVGADAEGTTALFVRSPQVVGHGMSPDTVNEAFGNFAADCAASAACAKFGDLTATVTAIQGRPPTTTGVNDANGTPIVLDKLSSQVGVAGAMWNSAIAPSLPGLLSGTQSAAGDDVVANSFVANGFPDPSAAELVTWCQDVDYSNPGIASTNETHGGLFVGMSYKRVCDAIGPVPQMHPLDEVKSSVPTVVVLPAYDGRSDRDTAMAIFRGFSALTILTIPYVSDPTAQLSCFNPMRTTFIEHPDSEFDASCVTASTFKTFE